MSTHVLLLRAPKEDDDAPASAVTKDPYEAVLTPALGSNTNVTSVPVYETAHTLAELSWILETGPAFHGYKGVVVTSRRAVEAWVAAAKSVPMPENIGNGNGNAAESSEERKSDPASWNHIPFYVVGEASATAARALRTSSTTDSGILQRLAPGEVFGGAETNTAEQLAHFIRTHVEERAAAAGSSTSLGSFRVGPVPPSPALTSNFVSSPTTDETASSFAGSTHEGGGGSAHASTDNLLAKSVPISPTSPMHATGQSNTGANASNSTTSQPLARMIPGRSRGSTLQRLPTKLLFLVGDKTRDVLPRVLTEGNPPRSSSSSTSLVSSIGGNTNTVPIEVDAVQVYATRPSAGLGAALEAAVKGQSNVKTWWIALFAPSGADAALPHLRQHFTLLEIGSSSSTARPPSSQQQKRKGSSNASSKKNSTHVPPQLPAAKLAAIGPTTATHLRDVLKLDVAAIASTPTPEALASAIKEAT